MTLKRVGILTGGVDYSGLNAVIRAITRAAIIQHNATVVSIEGGFDSLIFGQYQELLKIIQEVFYRLIERCRINRYQPRSISSIDIPCEINLF